MKNIVLMFLVLSISCLVVSQESPVIVEVDLLMYEKIVAYEYLWEKGISHDIPPSDVVVEKVSLSSRQLKEINKIFKGNTVLTEHKSCAACYYPRHALILYRPGEPHQSIHICFSCGNFSVNQGSIQALNEPERLEQFFKSLGFPVNNNEAAQ